jgi:hypothetical protein
MTSGAVANTLELKISKSNGALEGILQMLNAGMELTGETNTDPETLQKIQLLVNPPACTECPLYVKMNGIHYCGLKACWERKKRAWCQQEFNKVVARLGIPAYQKSDGPYRKADWNSRDAFSQLKSKKDPFLRLVSTSPQYSEDGLTKSPFAELVDTKPERITRAKERQASSGMNDYNSPAAVAKREHERELSNAAEKFRKLAPPVFASAFKELTNIPAMQALEGPKTKADWPKAKRLQVLHEALADDAIDRMDLWQKERQGPVALAKHLQGVAKEWGVKLPADWMERAQGMMPKETNEERGKKKEGKAKKGKRK